MASGMVTRSRLLRLTFGVAAVSVILVGGLVLDRQPGSTAGRGPATTAPSAIAPGPGETRDPAPDTAPIATPGRPSRSPVVGFLRPFEYLDAAGPDLISHSWHLLTFSGGIRVGSAESAWAHDCGAGDARTPLRADPWGFVHDLRTIAGVELGWVEESTTMGGHPALTGDQGRNEGCISDLHVGGDIALNLVAGGDHLSLDDVARWFIADVDGATIFVRVSASTPAGLDARLPSALRFVKTMRFLDRP
jgi:hypothetical protein